MSKLNPKLLPIAALLLMVLALLILATPLLHGQQTAFTSNGSRINRPFAFQGTPQPGNTFPGSGNSQGFVIEGTPPAGFPEGTNQGQGFPQTTTGRQFQGRGVFSLLRLGFLNGMTGTIVYTIALLVSLVAAVGMFLTKLWGKILGIVMAVLYLIVALISLIPIIFIQFTFRAGNSLNLILTIVHMVLALAVIVLVSIPPRKTAEVTASQPTK